MTLESLSKNIVLGILAAFYLDVSNAMSFEPSTSSCQFYRDLQAQYSCPKSTYLNEAAELCEKYLKMEPTLDEEIREFFPGIRFCLQDRLHEQLGPQLCEQLTEISVESHVSCYLENGFCDLSNVSKFKLAWITRDKVFKSPWRETGFQLNQSCLLNTLN